MMIGQRVFSELALIFLISGVDTGSLGKLVAGTAC